MARADSAHLHPSAFVSALGSGEDAIAAHGSSVPVCVHHMLAIPVDEVR